MDLVKELAAKNYAGMLEWLRTLPPAQMVSELRSLDTKSSTLDFTAFICLLSEDKELSDALLTELGREVLEKAARRPAPMATPFPAEMLLEG